MITFGEIIKDLRKEKNATQKEMAQALSVTVSTLSHWECDYQEPSFKDLTLLAKYFDVSTDYLLGLSDDFGDITVKAEKGSTPNFSKEAIELASIYEALTPPHRAQILEYARYFADKAGVSSKIKHA